PIAWERLWIIISDF
uniref:Uncharacterized protein n=1 Tax=Amphimedon queenslandica TaxID=400682 RepID=A0A1X7SHY2_AMPQE